jgi:hypothetical protein
MLYIATANKHKFERLEDITRQVFPELKVKDIYNKQIKPPVESGNDEFENAMIKARYYQSILGDNVLVEDDGIHFNGIGKRQQPDPKFGDIPQEILIRSKTDYWLKFLEKNKVKTGYIKYVFILATSHRYFGEKTQVPFSIHLTSEPSSDENILNNFIIPNRSKITFAKMSKSERNHYRATNIVPVVKRLLQPHISRMV